MKKIKFEEIELCRWVGIMKDVTLLEILLRFCCPIKKSEVLHFHLKLARVNKFLVPGLFYT